MPGGTRSGVGGVEAFLPIAFVVEVGPGPHVNDLPWIDVADMRRRTGPAVVNGMIDNAGANRIRVDINESVKQAGRAERARVEAVLPEVTAATRGEVEALGINHMRLPQRSGHGTLVLRRDDEVHMIGHEAVSQYAQVVLFTLGFESFEIEVPVGVGSKNRLTIVASLRDVVGRSDDNETLFAGHNVVSVLLHSSLCKPMLYKGLLSFTPVPDLPADCAVCRVRECPGLRWSTSLEIRQSLFLPIGCPLLVG